MVVFIGVSFWVNRMGGKKLAALVKGCFICIGSNVIMSSFIFFKVSGLVSSLLRKVINSALSLLIGLSFIELEIFSSKM